jgi:tetratricopeptide (TPR) repeat protein
VDAWQIPGRYLDFLRGGPAAPLADIVRHNHEDVRSLARLLAHAESRLGDAVDRRMAPAGDLAGLARAYRRLGRPEEALDCLDGALESRPDRRTLARSWTAILTTRADAPDERTRSSTHDRDTLLVDRARLLRRLGRHDEALATWRDLAIGGGRWAGVGWIEVAKILEHRRRDPTGALDACDRAGRVAERARFTGSRLTGLEADLARRRRRLSRKVIAANLGPTRANGRRSTADRSPSHGCRVLRV